MSAGQTSTRRGLTIAVTSGKGGVGKTTLAVNLAIALARFDARVGIVDANFGLGNVDVMFGLTPISHIGSVLIGEKTLNDIGAATTAGVRVFPAGNGITSLTALPGAHWERLRAGIADVTGKFDYLLVDTGPGIGDTALKVAQATDRAIVVTTCDPTAVVDAYAMTKLLIAAAPRREVGVVVNMARDAEEARVVARQLSLAVHHFLGASIRYYGFVERDPQVAESVLARRPLMALETDAPSVHSFERLAHRIVRWQAPAAEGVRPPAAQSAAMTPEDFARTEARSCA